MATLQVSNKVSGISLQCRALTELREEELRVWGGRLISLFDLSCPCPLLCDIKTKRCMYLEGLVHISMLRSICCQAQCIGPVYSGVY